MTTPALHREEVKAALRIAFGSLLAFERKKGLPKGSAKDVLRGRSVAQTEKAIAKALKMPLHALFPHRYNAKASKSSAKVDTTAPGADSHRQIAGER